MSLLSTIKQYLRKRVNGEVTTTFCNNCGIEAKEIWHDHITGKSFCSRSCVVMYSFRTGEVINVRKIK